MSKFAVVSTSVFILSTNNFHDDFLIKPEEDGSKHHKIMNWSVLVKYLANGKNAGEDEGLKALSYRLLSDKTFTLEHDIIKSERSNKETGAHGEQELIMVIVDIKDQERFDQALASLACGYCKKIYSTKAQMSYPTEVYSLRGRVKTWRPKCKECAKSSSFNTNIDDFSPVADSIAGTIITPEIRDEIWAALENATINMTSFGETFVPLVDVLKTASQRNQKVRSLYQIHEWSKPEDMERDNKAIWPLIYEIIALSDSNKYPSFKIEESTRDGPVLYVTYKREE